MCRVRRSVDSLRCGERRTWRTRSTPARLTLGRSRHRCRLRPGAVCAKITASGARRRQKQRCPLSKQHTNTLCVRVRTHAHTIGSEFEHHESFELERVYLRPVHVMPLAARRLCDSTRLDPILAERLAGESCSLLSHSLACVLSARCSHQHIRRRIKHLPPLRPLHVPEVAYKPSRAELNRTEPNRFVAPRAPLRPRLNATQWVAPSRSRSQSQSQSRRRRSPRRPLSRA